MNILSKDNNFKIDLYKLISLYEEVKNLKYLLKEKNKFKTINKKELNIFLSSYEIDYYSTLFRENGYYDGLSSFQIDDIKNNFNEILIQEFNSLLNKKINSEINFKRYKLELKNKYLDEFSFLENEFNIYRNIINNQKYNTIKKNDSIIKIGQQLKKEIYNIYNFDSNSIAFNSFSMNFINCISLDELYKNKTKYDSAFISFNLLVLFLKKIENFNFENYSEKEIGITIIKEKIKKLLKIKASFESIINN